MESPQTFRSLSLSPALLRNLDRLEYRQPTPIQLRVVAPALEGRDLLGIARTGSGKTAAFVIPLVERMLHGGEGRRQSAARRPKALVLCPTRELAAQVAAEAASLVNGTTLRVACVHGKVSRGPQAAALEEGVDLLVATPGRCRELLEVDALDLAQLRTVVLDEADRMLDMGFEPQVKAILDAAPKDRQTLLFTATMPPEVAALAEAMLRNPVRIEVDPTGTTVGHLRQRFVEVADESKVHLLLALLAGADGAAEPAASSGSPGGAAERAPKPTQPGTGAKLSQREGVLIFCRTRRRAHWIGAALARHGVGVGYLHGDRSHAQRARALAAFAARKHRVLVATDVAARGLHVDAVRTVIQYDLPLEAAEHVHRIGRAAHGLEGRGGSGESIAFVSPGDAARWREIVAVSAAAAAAPRDPGAAGASMEPTTTSGSPGHPAALPATAMALPDLRPFGARAPEVEPSPPSRRRERTADRQAPEREAPGPGREPGERTTGARRAGPAQSRPGRVARPDRAVELDPLLRDALTPPSRDARGRPRDPKRDPKREPKRDPKRDQRRPSKKSKPIGKAQQPGTGVKPIQPGTGVKPPQPATGVRSPRRRAGEDASAPRAKVSGAAPSKTRGKRR